MKPIFKGWCPAVRKSHVTELEWQRLAQTGDQRSRFFLSLLCHFWGDFLLRPQEEVCGSFLSSIQTPDSSEGDDFLS